MVKRTDFRPNNAHSHEISERDRETIRKNSLEHTEKIMEKKRFDATSKRAERLGFKVFRGGSGYRMSGIDAHGKHIQGEFITTSSVNAELDKIQHQKEQSVINREKEYRKEHGIKTDDDMYKHLKEGTSKEHKEHPSLSKKEAQQVARDHLKENPEYYDYDLKSPTDKVYVDSLGNRFKDTDEYLERNEYKYNVLDNVDYGKLSKKQRIYYFEDRNSEGLSHKEAIHNAKVFGERKDNVYTKDHLKEDPEYYDRDDPEY